MNKLIEETTMGIRGLAEWFGIKTRTFQNHQEEKLEELSLFCDYEPIYSPGGYLKQIYIKKVYIPEYSRAMNPLKQQFLDWIDAGGIALVASQTPDNVFSYPVVVNYFCKQNKIPYDGPHYYTLLEDGVNKEGRKIIDGSRRTSNPQYAQWHYLYNILKRYQSQKKEYCGNTIDCCANSFNPTRLRIETSEDRNTQNSIYQKYFGELSYEDVNELVEQISSMVDKGEISPEDKDFIMENRVMRSWSNQMKRNCAAQECAIKDVLRRKGYTFNTSEEETTF